MQKSKRISMYLYILVFFVVVMLLGWASFVNLVNFYINDEVDYNEWTVELGNKFETDINTNFYNKFEFINLNGAVRKLLGQQEMNGVVKLNNGYLSTTYSYCNDEKLEEYANKVIDLNEYLKSKDIALLYAQTPYTVSKYDNQLPAGVTDYGNDNVDRFLNFLYQANVDVIDFREEMYKDGIDQYDMMYRTDHHWTTEAGLYACSKVEDYLTAKLNCEVDERISDINNYSVVNYEKWHLGSNGQRTGIYYAGIDDFHLLMPKFETKIQGNGMEGTMEELIYNLSPLENKEYTSRYTYDYVLGNALGNYKNLDCKNDKKILIVTDSFGKCFNPYLIMGFGEVLTISNYESQRLSKEFIDECSPDAVILLYYPGMVGKSSSGFNFEIPN